MPLVKRTPEQLAVVKPKTTTCNDPKHQKRFLEWNGKTLDEVDAVVTFSKIHHAKKAMEDGTIIHNLLITFPKGERIAFPMSTALVEQVKMNPETIIDGEFYARKKSKVDPETGERLKDQYTDENYISYGRISGLDFDSEDLIAEGE